MSSKSKKKKKQRKLFNPQTRKRDAIKWLSQQETPADLIAAYSKRYECSHTDAHLELMEIGYQDEVAIQSYDKDGTDWEYKYDGYTGEMYVVPKGTPDSDLHEFY